MSGEFSASSSTEHAARLGEPLGVGGCGRRVLVPEVGEDVGAARDEGPVAYRLNRQVYYKGRPLRYAWQPEWRLRLARQHRAAKRFRRTANGFKHRQAYRNHILTKKASKRKRQLRGLEAVAQADVARVRRMLPTKAR